MFELPELSFAKDALGDWTSAETIAFHHGKHHAGYVNKLNGAVLGTEFEGQELEEVIKGARDHHPKIFNLAAQHYNHSFFWAGLSEQGAPPEGELAAAINRDFGSLEDFQEAFRLVAAGHFGSGWVWLLSIDGKLEIRDYHDAQTPVGTGVTPLLTLDVWEHAYYIDHRNDRGAFIEGFWRHINWKSISYNF